MHKLIALIKGSAKKEPRPNVSPESKPPSLHRDKPPRNQNNDTRPTYRIGRHKPSDIQRAIDLAG